MTQTQRQGPKEIHEMFLERTINGVASFMGLDSAILKKYVLDLMPECAVVDCSELEIIDTIERIYSILRDSDAWDYGVLYAPSTYNYAAAVVVWTYLYSYRGIRITHDCQLFGDHVAAAVMHFLATYDASKIGVALKRIKREALRYCLPP